jgi:hypothetical protein
MLATLISACTGVEASRQPVEVDMANVDLHITGDVTLHIKRMSGHFDPVGRDVAYLDDKRSYSVFVDSGEVAIDLASLNALMARSMGGDKSNVDKLRVSIKDGTLRQQGVIDSAINVPFKATSVVSATPDGRIRVSTKSVRGFGLPLRPVMSLFRIKMDNFVKTTPGSGVEADGNDLIVDPSVVIPAPSIRGRLTAVRIDGNQMVQTFGAASARASAPKSGNGTPALQPPLSPNHIYWRGSQLSFGKLTMTETDLELVDLDPNDPFDFSVDNWNAQLVAGYSKTMPNRGLRAFMPDYNDLKVTSKK